MSTCPTCSEERIPGALFCGSCGSRFGPDPPAGEPTDPLVGQTLNGTYLIQKKIGSGGMGEVYRALHTKLDAPVAVKIVKPALLGHASMVHRFQREARAASRLRHPNVVAVTDFGQTGDGTLFMVMEYVGGRSLAQVIADEAPLGERRVVHIGAQILAALVEAHANQVLHRDLKPENVMVEARRGAPDSVKVLDFGIAKVLAAGASASTLTQAGLVCGTPGYMSPEQLRGGEVDARTDLFSLGVVLYEMLTHKLPFDAQTPMEMLHRHLSEPVPAPGERRGRPVSPALEVVVLRALSAARDERPPSAEAMREELVHADLTLAEPQTPGTATGAATEILPRRPSSRSVPAPPRSGGQARTTPAPPDTPATPTTHARELPTVSRRTSSRPAERPRSRPGATATIGATALGRSAAFDKQVEARLAPLLGPVAPHLVRKVGQATTSLRAFCEQLAAYIPAPDDRKAFLGWCTAQLGGGAPTRERRATPSAPPTTPVAEWELGVLDRAREDLAPYVGPLARVLVRRAAARARDARELYELLARDIPSDADREAFRRRASDHGSGRRL
jgi:serine/threonine-protein kinase